MFPLYTTGGGVDAYVDSEELASFAPDGASPATAAVFLVLDVADDAAVTLPSTCSAADEEKPFYSDFFFSAEAAAEGSDEACPSTAHRLDASAFVEVVWLSDLIADMAADEELRRNNTLSEDEASDDDAADGADGGERNAPSRKQKLSSTIAPAPKEESIAAQAMGAGPAQRAVNALFQQTLERAPWPLYRRGEEAPATQTDVASVGDALSSPPIPANAVKVSGADGVGSSRPQTTDAYFFGCMPPPYLFLNPDSGRTELIFTQWTPVAELKGGKRRHSARPSYDLTAVPNLATSLVINKILREGFASAPEGDGGNKNSGFRFPIEHYVSHDHLAALMRRVKDKGYAVPSEERERQAALLAEALGNLMMASGEGEDSDDGEVSDV